MQADARYVLCHVDTVDMHCRYLYVCVKDHFLHCVTFRQQVVPSPLQKVIYAA